jgi:glucose-1-phosphate adenylyltransferase
VKKECIAMLLAGGQGSRLYVLTQDMAKPAVPFGGKYRIIDFPLSNCSNSGIDTVGVLTQYRPLELNSYIGSGQPWDLDHSSGGVHILPPYMSSKGGVWYKGTANAVYQNIDFIDQYDPDYVVILSGDHIYKMDYSQMVARHKETGAACTISVMEVPMCDASRFGILSVDGRDIITEFQEKPRQPKSNLASMGILRVQLAHSPPLSQRGRGGFRFIQRLRQGHHSENAGCRGADGLRSGFAGLLEGDVGHAGIPVGCQHGYALAGIRAGFAG